MRSRRGGASSRGADPRDESPRTAGPRADSSRGAEPRGASSRPVARGDSTRSAVGRGAGVSARGSSARASSRRADARRGAEASAASRSVARASAFARVAADLADDFSGAEGAFARVDSGLIDSDLARGASLAAVLACEVLAARGEVFFSRAGRSPEGRSMAPNGMEVLEDEDGGSSGPKDHLERSDGRRTPKRSAASDGIHDLVSRSRAPKRAEKDMRFRCDGRIRKPRPRAGRRDEALRPATSSDVPSVQARRVRARSERAPRRIGFSVTDRDRGPRSRGRPLLRSGGGRRPPRSGAFGGKSRRVPGYQRSLRCSRFENASSTGGKEPQIRNLPKKTARATARAFGSKPVARVPSNRRRSGSHPGQARFGINRASPDPGSTGPDPVQDATGLTPVRKDGRGERI